VTVAKEFECERDGVVIRGADDDQLLTNVERHIAEAHPDLAGKVSREDIVAAGTEASAMGQRRYEVTAGDGLVLRLKRILPAPRAAVYRALSDSGQLAKWWGPRGFTAPSVEFDPRPGGSYRIAMQPPHGDLFYLAGEFQEVDPPARLTYTFRWDPPDPDDRQTVVTLSLEDRGERTEVLLTQGEFATHDRLALHEEGWMDSFGRLDQVLSTCEGESAPLVAARRAPKSSASRPG
jgi:uncharacterized protein YndB with AHSA1/START domain